MARSWNITVTNTVTNQVFRDGVTTDLTREVEHLAKQFDLGPKIRTRRPEAGLAVHEYERGTVKVSRQNLETYNKTKGAVNYRGPA